MRSHTGKFLIFHKPIYVQSTCYDNGEEEDEDEVTTSLSVNDRKGGAIKTINGNYHTGNH